MKTPTGQLRERVILTSMVESTDSQGGHPLTPTTLATVWAKVSPASAREQLAAQAVSSQVDYKVEIQYRTDVTPTMRVLWTPYLGTQKSLQINSVVACEGRPDRLDLACVVVDR